MAEFTFDFDNIVSSEPTTPAPPPSTTTSEKQAMETPVSDNQPKGIPESNPYDQFVDTTTKKVSPDNPFLQDITHDRQPDIDWVGFGLIVLALLLGIGFTRWACKKRKWLWKQCSKIPLFLEFWQKLKGVLLFYKKHWRITGGFFLIVTGLIFYYHCPCDGYYHRYSENIILLLVIAALLIAIRWMYEYRSIPLIAITTYAAYLIFIGNTEIDDGFFGYVEDDEIIFVIMGFPVFATIAHLLFKSRNKNRKQTALYISVAWFLIIVPAN